MEPVFISGDSNGYYLRFHFIKAGHYELRYLLEIYFIKEHIKNVSPQNKTYHIQNISSQNVSDDTTHQ